MLPAFIGYLLRSRFRFLICDFNYGLRVDSVFSRWLATASPSSKLPMFFGVRGACSRFEWRGLPRSIQNHPVTLHPVAASRHEPRRCQDTALQSEQTVPFRVSLSSPKVESDIILHSHLGREGPKPQRGRQNASCYLHSPVAPARIGRVTNQLGKSRNCHPPALLCSLLRTYSLGAIGLTGIAGSNATEIFCVSLTITATRSPAPIYVQGAGLYVFHQKLYWTMVAAHYFVQDQTVLHFWHQPV